MNNYSIILRYPSELDEIIILMIFMESIQDNLKEGKYINNNLENIFYKYNIEIQTFLYYLKIQKQTHINKFPIYCLYNKL